MDLAVVVAPSVLICGTFLGRVAELEDEAAALIDPEGLSGVYGNSGDGQLDNRRPGDNVARLEGSPLDHGSAERATCLPVNVTMGHRGQLQVDRVSSSLP